MRRILYGMSINLHSEGGAGEVTGSRHILTVDGRRFLIDCGAVQGKREVAEKKNQALVKDPAGLEACVLTHAHYDHCGMLPLLAKRGYTGNIFATPATRDLAGIIMMDSANIMARDAEYLAKQAKKRGEVFTWKPLFDEKDVIQATSQFVTVSYNRPLPIGDGVTIELFDAGHILGSAMVRAEVRDSSGKTVSIAFTGDLGRKNKPIIRDPQVMPAADYVMLESTYGDRLHESADDATSRLAAIVKDAAARGGKIIIPSFAIERTQELVYHFHLLSEAGEIPNIPIYVDSPMAINATSIFQIHPECYDTETYDAFLKHHKNPFGFNQLRFTQSADESKAINDLKGPAVIISADGMCEAGRIQHHLKNHISDPNTTILIVGYMADGTLGRRIRDGEKEVRIHGEFFKVNARVEQINAFSAHADYQEAWDWLSTMDLSKLKRVFLVHGESDAIAAFQKFLTGKGLKDVRVVKYGETYEL